MAKGKVTLEIEFDAKDVNSARAAFIRLKGEVRVALAHGHGGLPTGIVSNSVIVTTLNETIDGNSVT